MSTPSAVGTAGPTLIEKLRQIADARPAGLPPPCLCGDEPWPVILAAIAKEAADALDKMHAIRAMLAKLHNEAATHEGGYAISTGALFDFIQAFDVALLPPCHKQTGSRP